MPDIFFGFGFRFPFLKHQVSQGFFFGLVGPAVVAEREGFGMLVRFAVCRHPVRFVKLRVCRYGTLLVD